MEDACEVSGRREHAEMMSEKETCTLKCSETIA